MTPTEIYNKCITELDTHTIVSNATKDKETPLGFLLTYLKDDYRLSKIEGYPIAEKIIKHFNL